MSEQITSGKQVTLHFSLSLPSGEVIDSTRDKKPNVDRASVFKLKVMKQE